ncbi:hypothetical protein CEP51_012197 [Fusarium floridanum]|uniref:Uncharacterized protein n=1 Tax=Fusarium floridanum TaxID=1325733 RepID=A0A428QYJ2_9HYPO|nr:hypothetical protein CEP51_012197 [Fusarium floridanum]
MPEYDYRFRTINEFNYTHPTPILWQAWQEAYFRKIGSVLHADGEPVSLFESGCTADGWTAPSCIRTCSNAKYMFSSPENVWNCVALAVVTMEVVPGNKSVDPVNFKEMNEQFDLGGSLEAFDKLHVLMRLQRCFWQSCSESKHGNCTSELEDFRCNPVSLGNIKDFSRVINHAYCRDADLGVDSDIAGPGILVAYMVQIALALIMAGLFWATYQPWKRLKTAIGPFFGASGRASMPETRTEANHLTLVVSELQDAQIAFALTVGVVFCLAFLAGSRLGLGNISSVLSYFVNHDIAFGLLVVGTCSIAFLHPSRQRVGKHVVSRSVFMIPMVLSWWLMITAHILKTRSSWTGPEHLIEILRENVAVEDCGNYPGPMSFCLGPLLQGPDKSHRVFETTTKLSPVVHILFAIVFFEEGVISLRGRHKFNTRSSFSGRVYRILSWIPFLANLMSFIMVIICLVEVVIAFKKLQELSGGQYSWGFGQLVSMAVWIPVMVNFFTFLIFGTEEGIEARIHKDLQVSRVGTFVRASQGMPGENGSDEGQNFPLLAAVPSTASIQVMESNAPVGPLDADRP